MEWNQRGFTVKGLPSSTFFKLFILQCFGFHGLSVSRPLLGLLLVLLAAFEAIVVNEICFLAFFACALSLEGHY